MYSSSRFQRYQALQILPLLSDQHPSELMDKILILLPEDEKPNFTSADIRAHLLSESISDPRGMALRVVAKVFQCKLCLILQLKMSMLYHSGIPRQDLEFLVLGPQVC